EKSPEVPTNFKLERIEHRFLLPIHYDDNAKRHGKQNESLRSSDVKPSGKRQDNSGEKDKGVKQINQRNDEIDGDEKARKTGIFPCQAAVLFQSLEHSSGPSSALTEEAFEVNRRAGESDGACFKSNAAPRFEQCPSE